MRVSWIGDVKQGTRPRISETEQRELQGCCLRDDEEVRLQPALAEIRCRAGPLTSSYEIPKVCRGGGLTHDSFSKDQSLLYTA